VGWYSVVGMAACYRLDSLGIKSYWGGGKIFHTCPDQLWSPPCLLYNGYWVYPGIKSSWGVVLTTHPYLTLRLKEEQSYTSAPSLGLHGLLMDEIQLLPFFNN